MTTTAPSPTRVPSLETWDIVDSRTGKPVTNTSFLSEDQCWAQITEWQDRYDHGGRPDITLDMLLHMKPVLSHTRTESA